jgi:hypothetical protein
MDSMPKKESQTFVYILGGTIGLLTGLAAVYLLIKNQESSPEKTKLITSKDGLKISVGLAGLLKQIADLGKIG